MLGVTRTGRRPRPPPFPESAGRGRRGNWRSASLQRRLPARRPSASPPGTGVRPRSAGWGAIGKPLPCRARAYLLQTITVAQCEAVGRCPGTASRAESCLGGRSGAGLLSQGLRRAALQRRQGGGLLSQRRPPVPGGRCRAASGSLSGLL